MSCVRLCLKETELAYVTRPQVLSTDDALRMLQARIGDSAHERFVALMLDGQNRVITTLEVAIGTASRCEIDTKVLFAGALLCGATGLIVSHNHPSGSNVPSVDDKALTILLKAGAQLLGLRILDHIIVTPDATRYYSFAASR